MSALLIKTSQSLEARATDIKLPVMTGLEVCSFLDTSLGKAARNLAPGKPDLTLVGAPSVNDNRVGITSGSAYFQSDCLETTEATLISVARLTSAGTGAGSRPMLISSYQDQVADSGFGASLFLSSAAVFGTAGLTGLTNWSAAPAITPTNWHFLYTIITTTSQKTGSKTTGVSSTDLTPANARVVSGRKYRIGSAFASYLGTADMAFAAIYSGALSDANITSLYDWLKPILAARTTAITI
jgi:hypothetical protein